MENENTFLSPTGQNISIRFTGTEAEFINENYSRIAGTDDRLSAREFFFRAVEMAVSMRKPKVAETSLPADLLLIEELQQRVESLTVQLNEANADIESKVAYIDEITSRDINHESTAEEYERKISEMATRIKHLSEKQLPDNAILLDDLSGPENMLIQEYARIMKCTPKQVLVDKLFLQTVWSGPGDYIPRLNSDAKKRIRETYKSE